MHSLKSHFLQRVHTLIFQLLHRRRLKREAFQLLVSSNECLHTHPLCPFFCWCTGASFYFKGEKTEVIEGWIMGATLKTFTTLSPSIQTYSIVPTVPQVHNVTCL